MFETHFVIDNRFIALLQTNNSSPFVCLFKEKASILSMPKAISKTFLFYFVCHQKPVCCFCCCFSHLITNRSSFLPNESRLHIRSCVCCQCIWIENDCKQRYVIGDQCISGVQNRHERSSKPFSVIGDKGKEKLNPMTVEFLRRVQC